MADVITDEELRSGPVPPAFADAPGFDEDDDETGEVTPAAPATASKAATDDGFDVRAELDVLRQELAEERKANRELLLKAIGEKQEALKREAKARPTGEQMMDGIATGGMDYLRDLLNDAAEELGFVRRDQLNEELGQFGQRLVQTQAKDTEIFEEFPELRARDKDFIADARKLVEKAKEMGPEGQIMYLAAAAVKAQRAGKAAATRPNPRAYEGGRSSGAPASRTAAPEFSGPMLRTLRELGIK